MWYHQDTSGQPREKRIGGRDCGGGHAKGGAAARHRSMVCSVPPTTLPLLPPSTSLPASPHPPLLHRSLQANLTKAWVLLALCWIPDEESGDQLA
ncbi:hypothetical protein Pmani_034119 [Petrolisthes manimaculis]|uniref:Uncharacterized protein n=1 Tax=Petrolisthes manimaculis TaxID=1843537 RepID=A0AAE1NN84_9EUCA|nr:hypothetical protein Pmani_034119 [Petrolisthes manimaculis]